MAIIEARGLARTFKSRKRTVEAVRGDAMIVAVGRNTAAAFRLASKQVLVMSDGGAHALLFPISAQMRSLGRRSARTLNRAHVERSDRGAADPSRSSDAAPVSGATPRSPCVHSI